MEKTDKLDLRVIHRAGDSTVKHERHTIDFIVNGQSLYELLGASKFDMVGRFSQEENLALNRESAEVFKLKQAPDLENGRCMLYVCSECGDIGCGAITIKISESSGIIEWSEFGYENDYDPQMTDMASFKQVGPFRFEKIHYEKVILKAVG